MVDPSGFVCFGEVMLRLSPPGHQRFVQASSFDASFGGGEANVAVALAQLGIETRFVSTIPGNEIGQSCLNSLRGWGVDVTKVVRSGNRLGIYFLEHGAAQRASKVLYDRAGSAIAEAPSSAYDWEDILGGKKWFHFTGITPALSSNAFEAVLQAATTAKRLGLRVSCDLNYRSKLWSKDQARAAMTELMPCVDTLIANEEDADAVFGISAQGADVHAGQIDHARYSEVAKQLADRFGFGHVAITLRESISASRNGWSALLYEGGKSYFSRHYDIEIVDRVGSGDSFAAGIIFGLMQGLTPQETVEFGAAAGCLAHSISGDFPIFSLAEVEALARGGGSGRVQR